MNPQIKEKWFTKPQIKENRITLYKYSPTNNLSNPDSSRTINYNTVTHEQINTNLITYEQINTNLITSNQINQSYYIILKISYPKLTVRDRFF